MFKGDTVDFDLLLRIGLITGSTFLVVATLVPFVKKMATHIEAIDYPNERKIHQKPIPRLGGIALFLGFLFGYMVFSEPSGIMNSILIGSFLVVLVGVIDDIKPLTSKVKFLGQLAAALIIVFYGNILISDVGIAGQELEFGFWAYPLTLFFIVGCINCMNFIDGLDGLASGISAVYFLTIGIIAIVMEKFGLDFTLTFIMLGCVLGFLIYNFNPASIFMGDSGSMFLGFVISVVALLGFKNVTLTSLIVPLIILAIPILDIIFAIIRRSIKGQSVSVPDKFHIHHQLLAKKMSQRVVVAIIICVNILFAAASLLYLFGDPQLGKIVYAILVLIVLFFVLKTNIIIEDTHRTRLREIFSKRWQL